VTVTCWRFALLYLFVEAADVEKTERTELHYWLHCGREED